MADVQAMLSYLDASWLDGLDGEDLSDGQRLLGWLVDDLVAEADRAPDPAAVLKIQMDDMDALLPPGGPPERLRALRTHVLHRQIERLGLRTLALGEEILAGPADSDDARARGLQLLHKAETLGRELQTLPSSPKVDAARRELSEVVMEALFAVHGKAMSHRLALLWDDAPGPPDLLP